MATMTVTKSELLTPVQAAEYLGLKPQTLATWRCNKRYGIPFVRVGNVIRYRAGDLEKWLLKRTVTPEPADVV